MLYKKGEKMRKRLRFCCSDREYQGMLADYVRRYWQEYFLVVQEEGEEEILVTETEKTPVTEGGGKKALAASREDAEAVFPGPGDRNSREIFYLSEEQNTCDKAIYRYQSLDQVMRELLFKTGNSVIPGVSQKVTRLILFFTPGGNCAQTLAAKQFSRRMGAMEKVLFIHYGAFGVTGEEEQSGREDDIDLSTLCFYIYSRGVEDLTREKVMAAVRKAESYEYLAYFHNPIHVARMKEEFSQLLEKVLSFGLYDRIVLDLDELPFELEGILRKTSELYCVVPAEQGIRESYAIRSGDWQAFLKKLDLDPVNLMVKEWEYRVG